MIMQKRYNEIDLAKGFAIILAVFGHAAPDAVKGFWIIGTDSVSASLHYLVYSFHMALFFVCSGFLLYPKLSLVGEGYIEILKKFKRLMIPYFFLSCVYLGGKMLGEGLADNQLTDNPVIGILFGSSPCFGAWFLWCLFSMTLIVMCLRKVNLWVLFALFIVISYIPIEYTNNFMGVEKVQANMMWLLLGCMVRKYYDKIILWLTVKTGIIAMLVLIVLHLSIGIFESNHLVNHSYSIIKTLSGIFASFTLCFILGSKAIDNFSYRVLKLCGEYCMDIYILSMFVLVPLRILYVNMGGMYYVPYYLWLVIVTILGVIIPIISSRFFVRKIRFLRVLLIGG